MGKKQKQENTKNNFKGLGQGDLISAFSQYDSGFIPGIFTWTTTLYCPRRGAAEPLPAT